MSEDRKRILQMLEDGTITVDEASSLLEALGGDEDTTSPPDLTSEEPAAPATTPLSVPGWRDTIWKIPFYVGVGLLTLFGLLIAMVFATSQGEATFWLICLWSFFLLAALLTMLAFWSRAARWLYVDVREKDGKRILFGLPVPIQIARWGINIGRGFVDEETANYLNVADEFMQEMDSELGEPGSAPLVVDVDDGDGDQVKIYFG